MAISSTKPKVLIADDEKVIADTLALILNMGGFEARAVYTCQNALEMAPAFHPDVLISDVLMADLNGVDAAIEMRALLPELRVLLLSGQSATAEMLARSPARSFGFEVLVKPVHPQALIQRLLQGAAEVKNLA
ncbi:MAG TPA: response regulator [Terracidiphilus sp.]|jgi:CheY-like chemotaxis protein|nr:response regulator [Terracidiphilus sp.]